MNFPLKSVMPICVRLTGWLKNREDREDAIQNSLVEILKYPYITELPPTESEALVRKIAYSEACDIWRKNIRYAKYFNIWKTLDHSSGGFQGLSSEQTFPNSLYWTNKERELAEELVYRRQRSQILFKKLNLCTPKQQFRLLLLMAGCGRREFNWIAGKGYRNIAGNAIEGAKERIRSTLPPELKKEIESEYRGNKRKGGRKPKNSRRLFYEDSNGVHRYARPGSKAYEIYQEHWAKNPIEVGKLVDGSN